MNENEWNNADNRINVEFTNDNLFIEKMKLDIFASRVEAFGSIYENMCGKVLPVTDVLKRIFGYNEKEILDNIKKIVIERHDPFLKTLYPPLEDGEGEIDLSDLEKSNINLNDIFDMGGIQGSVEEPEEEPEQEETPEEEPKEEKPKRNIRNRRKETEPEKEEEPTEEPETEQPEDALKLGDFDTSDIE